jgi:hypothetical protein
MQEVESKPYEAASFSIRNGYTLKQCSCGLGKLAVDAYKDAMPNAVRQWRIYCRCGKRVTYDGNSQREAYSAWNKIAAEPTMPSRT